MESGIDLNDLPPIFWNTPIADVGYPRIVMPALHVSGCNLRCPYCLNYDLIKGKNRGDMDANGAVSQLFASGEEWVMVSGAEPLFNHRTVNLLALIKSLGMRVALATNGTFPDRLEGVVEMGLVDHVVMDIKTSLDIDKYADVSGMPSVENVERIIRSAEFLKGLNEVTCEFRTTMCSKYVTKDDVISIAKFIGEGGIYSMQYYTTHQTLLADVADKKYIIPYETLKEWAKEIEEYVFKVFVCEV